MNLRKDIDELLLQANMEKLKKAVAIMKINFDKEKDLQLCQLLRILQTHVDLLVVSDIKQILFHMMHAKKAAQQSKDKKTTQEQLEKVIFRQISLGLYGLTVK